MLFSLTPQQVRHNGTPTPLPTHDEMHAIPARARRQVSERRWMDPKARLRFVLEEFSRVGGTPMSCKVSSHSNCFRMRAAHTCAPTGGRAGGRKCSPAGALVRSTT